jgi:hypothetical protein
MPIPGPQVLLPLVIILSTFGFILSVILIGKSPKAGACLVGGLIFALPILLYRAALAGTFSTPMGLPFVIIPGTFLFVLVVVVLTKTPKAGVALIVALVALGLFGLFFGMRVSSSRQAGVVRETMPGPGAVPEAFASASSSQPSATPAPIWAAGIDKELDADVYPSKLAAVQVLGARIDKSVRELVGDVNTPPQITLFQEESDRALMVELKNAIGQVLPQATCAIEAERKNIPPNEVGVSIRVADMDQQPAPWARSTEVKAASGSIELSVSAGDRRVTARKRFVEKPWMESFATFASTRPQQAFIIARSVGTCTSESEANQQALDDARARLTEAIGQRSRWMSDKLPRPEITTTDVLQGGFIVDRFAQSFAGSVGKIWRQALLIDVSGPKLAQLAGQKTREFREVKMTWARMGLSALGVLVLIGVIYFFLNMATMGYYEWSLRIAGVVLAIVAVLSILMVVQ